MDRHHDAENSLANRREFIKKAILGTGVAFGAPAILSAVRPSDLSAQASGGRSNGSNGILGAGNGRGNGRANGRPF
ncbi:MAG: hypothetical protein EA421_11825 [Gemmatimonadales bacterium]|nr:MAG: hypothetical protein EA421_11825 [Gemmatimonadales bacterium]